jgi:hypothetical protein
MSKAKKPLCQKWETYPKILMKMDKIVKITKSRILNQNYFYKSKQNRGGNNRGIIKPNINISVELHK